MWQEGRRDAAGVWRRGERPCFAEKGKEKAEKLADKIMVVVQFI